MKSSCDAAAESERAISTPPTIQLLREEGFFCLAAKKHTRTQIRFSTHGARVCRTHAPSGSCGLPASMVVHEHIVLCAACAGVRSLEPTATCLFRPVCQVRSVAWGATKCDGVHNTAAETHHRTARPLVKRCLGACAANAADKTSVTRRDSLALPLIFRSHPSPG